MNVSAQPDAELLAAWRGWADDKWLATDGHASNLEDCVRWSAILIEQPAATPAGAAVKLRLALWTNTTEPWLMAVALGANLPDIEYRMAYTDLIDRTLWSTICSLEANGSGAIGTHRQWLAERNQFLSQLNDDDDCAETRSLHRETTRREVAIGSAPPTTQDDVIAKLIYIAQIVVEGGTPNDDLVGGTIAEARRFLGMGSLGGSSVAIREAFDA